MKIHIATDANMGQLQMKLTSMLPKLLRETVRLSLPMQDIRATARVASSWDRHWRVNQTIAANIRQNSKVRARIEHCFRVIKCQFGYKKRCATKD